MKHQLVSALAACIVVASWPAAIPTPAGAAPQDLGHHDDHVSTAATPRGASVVPNRWFVEVKGAPVADGASSGQVARSQDAVVSAAGRQGLHLRSARRYSRTFNGMAVTMDQKQAARLASVPGVTAVYPVVNFSLPDVEATPDDLASDALGGAAIVRDHLGYTGKGIRVGVIDSGIDFTHPDFGGKGTKGTTRFPTKRVAFGYDFVGDDYDSDATGSAAIPKPDPVPNDCTGHGTHDAGIIGANGNPATGGVVGVAPGVTLGAYRVFGCKGTTSAEVVLAALDRAQADHMDVVNLSLDAPLESWPDYPTAQAADALTRHGIVVVAAVGDAVEQGVFGNGAPGVGHDTLSVTSVDDVAQLPSLEVDGTLYGYENGDGVPEAPTSGSLTLAALGEPGTDAAAGCSALDTTFAPGTAVLVERGGCSFRDKAANAAAAGASAVLMYNNAPGAIAAPGVAGDPALEVPVVLLSQDDGRALVAKALAGGSTMTWTARTVPSGSAGMITSISSYGPAADLTLKPDLAAPGGNIWSTYPLAKGGHASMTGTSMATAYVSGSVALLLQARPDLRHRPRQVRTLLQNTARHDAPWSMSPLSGLLEPVVRQGAGLIQLDRALVTQQTITPSSISVGDDRSGKHTTTLVLHNTSRKTVVYTLTNQTSVGTLGTTYPDFDVKDANVTMPTTVVVGPRRRVRVPVTITAPTDAENGYLYGGWIVATSPTGQTLDVPYLGMAGSYRSLPVLSVAGSAVPCLASATEYVASDGPDACLADQGSASFSMTGTDEPMVQFRLEYPVQHLTVRLYRVNASGSRTELLGTIEDDDHVGRKAGDVDVRWDGTYTTTGRHPYKARAGAGRYELEVLALRATGNPRRPADWDRWTSQPFTATFSASTNASSSGTTAASGSATTTPTGR